MVTYLAECRVPWANEVCPCFIGDVGEEDSRASKLAHATIVYTTRCYEIHNIV